MLPEGAKPILNADARPGFGGDSAPAPARGWGRILGAVFVFSVVVGFGSLVAYFFVQNREGALEPAAVPVVRADPRPVKLRPDTPGGIEVPFQNTQIYDRVGQQSAGLAGGGERPGSPQGAIRPVERLLPGPEAPLPRPVPPPAPVAAIPATPDVTPPPNAVVVAQPPPPRAAVQAAPPVPAPAPAPATPAPAPAAVARAPAVPAAAGAPGGIRIQLASLRAEADAQREWARLQRQHADVLGGLTPSYPAADLGERGVYIRLQAGPFPIPEGARAACETLRARGVGCNVVR